MEEVKKLIKIFNNAFNMLNRDIIQTTITKEQVLAIENLINKNKELEKMVELMAFSLADYVMYYEYDKCRNPEMIKAKANEEINYFKKKASEENEAKNT